MAITILELAKHRGAQEVDGSINGAEFHKVGLAIMGGCGVCGATLAAYNACPSKEGYWVCKNDCSEMVECWDNVVDANLDIFVEEICR